MRWEVGVMGEGGREGAVIKGGEGEGGDKGGVLRGEGKGLITFMAHCLEHSSE